MIKNIIISVLCAFVGMLTVALVHTENQKYALLVGMCKPTAMESMQCLQNAKTRTNWKYHIFYALASTYQDLFAQRSINVGVWEGVVYPNKHDLTAYQAVGVYASLNECREKSLQRLEQVSSKDFGDYECGLNCIFESTTLMRICEKTEK